MKKRSVRARAGRFFVAGVACVGGPLLGLAVACATRPGAPRANPPRTPLALEAPAPESYVTPAHFRYHPREPARILASEALAGGQRLLVSERGERWLLDTAHASLRVAPSLAPEALTAVLHEGSGFWFVGKSGTAYFSSEPLRGFERSSAPPEAYVSVTAANDVLLGVRAARSLARSSDFGLSWQPVGPSDAHVIAVGLENGGRGLALAVPEALFTTADFGATWQKLNAPSHGWLGLDRGSDGRVRLSGPLGTALWQSETGNFSPAPAGANEPPLPAPARGPDATAIAEGRAALAGQRYFELERTQNRFRLWSGAFDGALAARDVDALGGCRSVRLAAFDAFVGVACARVRDDAQNQPVELYLSRDAGVHWSAVAGTLDASFPALRLALGAGGQWLASGVCAWDRPSGGCSPVRVQHALEHDAPAAADGAAPGASPSSSAPATAAAAAAAAKNGARPPGKKPVNAGAPSALPSLGDAVFALAFSSDGRSAYALGRRTKTSGLALFVSHDGGATFLPHDLELTALGNESEEEALDLGSMRVDSLSAAEDGALAITFAQYGRTLVVVTDEDGKLIASTRAPEARSVLGASGLRVIAVTPASRQVWESLDGGVSWEPTSPLPLSPCGRGQVCEVPVRCGLGGCVIGRELTRIGWGGRDPDSAALLPPPVPAASAAPERRVLTPLSCTLEAGGFRALPGVRSVPRAEQAALGGVAWFALAEDSDHAGAALVRANRGRIETVPLLAPTEHAEQQAYVVVPQVEGVAAVRYRTPEAAPGLTNLSEVDVAWADLFAGRTVRTRLRDGGAFVPGDYVRGGGRAQKAQPDLVTIAPGGLYLRLHASRAEQPTFFLDARGVETLPAVSWPRERALVGRAEMTRIGASSVPFVLVGQGAALVRARRAGSSWSFDAYAPGMSDADSFGLTQSGTIAYVGDRPGLSLETIDASGASANAQFFGFRADGAVLDPPLPVPTQRALGDRPELCDGARRATTPRVIAAANPGMRHPVVVLDAVEGPRTLLSDSAVLYGTPAAPCAAAFEALSVPSESNPAPRESALILLDDLEHAVLFRIVGEASAPRVEQRSMSCHFDSHLEIPPEVYRALGNNNP